MARRLPSVIALVAVLLLSLPTAALAYSARLDKPSNGVVTGTTEVHVRVSREGIDVPITGLRVRPAGGGEWRPTECVSDCERGESPVFRFTLDPRTGAPFGGGIMRNGPFEFEGRISREFRQEDQGVGRFTLNLRVPGSAVGGLAATVNGDTVRLAWSRAPEPDVEGYRVERCTGSCDASGSWRPIGDPEASASSYTDRPGVGTHSYRVVTLRSAGGDGTIETVSAPVTTEVEPAPVGPDDGVGTGGGTGGGTGPADGGDRGGSSGPGDRGTDGDGRPRTGAAPELEAGEVASEDGQDPPRTAGSRSSSRTGGIRSGRAPSVSLGRGGSDIPELPGIGDIFRGELDYSADDPQAAEGGDGAGAGEEGGEEGDEVVLSAPGRSGGSFIGRLTDPDRVAVPIAGGLLMTAVGLHLWRWLRIPLG